MNDISESEQRLSAALERIDYGIDRLQAVIKTAQSRPAPPPTIASPISDDMASLQQRQTKALDRAQQRLAASGSEAARLAAANDRLMESNRALIAGQSGAGAGDAVLQALETEIEALRAARAAEIAQMGDILAALETMLGIPETEPLPPSDPAQEALLGTPADFSSDVEPVPMEGRILRFDREDEADFDEPELDEKG